MHVSDLDRWSARLSRVISLGAFGVALGAVALEWVARQAIGSNVLLGWIEAAGVAGAIGAAFALPAIVDGRSAPASEQGRRYTVAYFATALAFAASLWWFVLSADLNAARSYFFPTLTLRVPIVAIALGTTAWLLREAFALWRPASESAESRRHERRRADGPAPAVVALLVAIAIIAVQTPSAEEPGGLLSQIFWGLVSQDGFLALVGTGLLIETLHASSVALAAGPPRPPPSCPHPGMLRGAAGLMMSATAGSRHAGWQFVGYLSPIGRLALLLGLWLGLGASEALAALAVPWALAAAAIAALQLAAARAAPAEASTRTRSSALATASVILATAFTCAVVLLGYARTVEGVAFSAVAAFALFALLSRGRNLNGTAFVSDLSGSAASIVLYAFAGACVYTAADLLDVDRLAANVFRESGACIPCMVAAGFVAAMLLARRLGPLAVMLCLLPTLVPALAAVGMPVAQQLVTMCATVASGELAARFVAGAHSERAFPAFAFACLGIVLVLVVAAVPTLSTELPRGRFW